MMRALPLLLLPVLAGCPIGNNRYPRPTDLSPAWRIDKLRVLAVRAEPPEVRPGEQVTFEALVLDPEGTSGGVVWIACPPGNDDGVGFGCGLSGDLQFADGTAEGIIGVQPGLDPRYTPPGDLLVDVPAEERAEGVYQLIQVAVLPEGLLDDGFGEGGFDGDLDFNEVEVGYKRLIVSEATTPNRNPEVGGFSVDGWTVDEDAVIELDPGERYSLGLFLPASSIERYAFTRDDGTIEYRREEPYVTWYTDAGTLEESATLFPFLDAGWRAPDAETGVTSGTWWAVVRDRRGGMTWTARRWRLRGTTADTDAP